MRTFARPRAMLGALMMATLVAAAMMPSTPVFSQGLRVHSGGHGVTVRPGLNGLRAGILVQQAPVYRPGPVVHRSPIVMRHPPVVTRPVTQIARPVATSPVRRGYGGNRYDPRYGPVTEQRVGYYNYSRATRESIRYPGYRYNNAETVSAGETYFIRRFAQPQTYGSSRSYGYSPSGAGSYGSAGSGYSAAYGYPLVQTRPVSGYSYGAPVYGKKRKGYSASWGVSHGAAVYWPGHRGGQYSSSGRERLKSYDSVYGKVSAKSNWSARGGSHFDAARQSFSCTSNVWRTCQ